jgi:hypothetical protein
MSISTADEIAQMAAIFAGAIVWCVLNSYVLRWCGFRLVREAPH